MTTKRIMTEEARKALLGKLPISGNGFTFTPDIYPEEFHEFSPIVTIRMLTVSEKLAQENEPESMGFDEKIIKHSYLALLDIKNYFDISTGEEVDVKKNDGKIDFDWYCKQPISFIYSVYSKIIEISSLMVKENKAEKESLG